MKTAVAKLKIWFESIKISCALDFPFKVDPGRCEHGEAARRRKEVGAKLERRAHGLSPCRSPSHCAGLSGQERVAGLRRQKNQPRTRRNAIQKARRARRCHNGVRPRLTKTRVPDQKFTSISNLSISIAARDQVRLAVVLRNAGLAERAGDSAQHGRRTKTNRLVLRAF